MNPITWIEIPATDLKRAKNFYECVLGLELSLNEMGPLQMAWFPMDPEASGATGTLVKSDEYKPSHEGSLVYFETDDIDGTLSAVEANGGRTLVPKTDIGEYGFYAHFEDTEGNRVALHSQG